jgi:hypothetical protein
MGAKPRVKRLAVHASRVSAGVLLVASLAWGITALAAGCSSSSAAPPAAEASTACPDSIDASVGAACSKEGEVCSPTYSCGFFTVTIDCTCLNGTFQCLQGDGGTLSPGEAPSCGKPPPNPPACPATEGAATNATCSSAANGQECAYPPECDGGTQVFDLCTCGASPNGGAFVYSCQNSCDNGTGPAPDSGSSSDGSTDSGGDAPGDAPGD